MAKLKEAEKKREKHGTGGENRKRDYGLGSQAASRIGDVWIVDQVSLPSSPHFEGSIYRGPLLVVLLCSLLLFPRPSGLLFSQTLSLVMRALVARPLQGQA